MATLNKQIWLNQLLKNYYPVGSFLNFVRDFSPYVEFDRINLAESGFDPKVLINNTTYPIITNERVDTPLSLELNLYQTENTLVRKPETIELAYDKTESVIYGHRMSLLTTTHNHAAHAYAPNSNTTNTPVIATTGNIDAKGNKQFSVEDVLSLKEEYDALNYPPDSRYLVLDPKHLADLIRFDLKAFKDVTDFVNGKPKRTLGFNILEYSKNPKYDATTMQKVPFDAIPNANHTYSSFSFISDEVMKADGSVDIHNNASTEHRANIIGFDKRFLALPLRNKGIGAIVTAKS